MKRQKIRKGIILVSFLLLPVTLYYLSPVLILMGASEGVIAGCVIVFGLMFLTSLFFGRAFCGWVCPVGGVQECLTMAADKRAKGKRLDWIKYFIWTPMVLTFLLIAFTSGGLKIDFLYQTFHGISVAEPHALVVYFSVLTLVVILSLAAGRRAFCHYVCWMAPFMVIGTKIKTLFRYPSLHLETQTERCTGCRLCTKKCPMSLDVNAMVAKKDMYNPECILCGECADTCPKGVIKYSVKRVKR